MEWFPQCRDGGLDRYFYEQLQALAAAGVQGMAMASSCEPTQVGEIGVKPMAPLGASLLRRWRGARELATAALGRKVELVNAHFALYAFGYLDQISASVPLVVNFQGPWAEEMRVQSRTWGRRVAAKAARQIELRVYRRATRVITLSSAFRNLIHRDYGVPLERIHVIPGALNLQRYFAAPDRAESRRCLGWPAGRTVLLTVRRLAKRMGLDLLIEAVAAVRKEFPEILLLIGGKGPEHNALKARIAELQLQEQVKLLGFIAEDDLPLAYAAADVSVVPTMALEGFGLITVESLASGTPVLGTAVGATPEILSPLAPQLVFAEPTAEAMARRLREVLRGKVQLPDRQECRAYAERYTWGAVVPRILEVYQEAIEECRGR